MSVGHALIEFESGLRPILVLLPLLSLTVCVVIAISGWQRRRNLALLQEQAGVAQRFDLGRPPVASGVVDVAAELDAVLQQFEGRAAKQLTALESAVQSGLTVGVDPGAFRAVLFDLVGSAIAQTPCGRVLVSARRIDNRVRISTSDDGAQADGPRPAHVMPSGSQRCMARQCGSMRDHPRGPPSPTLYRIHDGASSAGTLGG